MKSEKLKIELINFKTSKDYEYNLKRVIEFIENSPADFLLFPEVCLTGFDYENWHEVNKFGEKAFQELSELKKPFALTLIYNNKNYFCFFDNGLVHKRAKYNLFGNEKEHFETGSEPDIFEWRGMKIANLICFELRFIEYWKKFEGADLILVPARWGRERIEHFKILNKALALSTQSQVIASNSANEKAYGCCIDAWGEGLELTTLEGSCTFNLFKNEKIRKKINIGIK